WLPAIHFDSHVLPASQRSRCAASKGPSPLRVGASVLLGIAHQLPVGVLSVSHQLSHPGKMVSLRNGSPCPDGSKWQETLSPALRPRQPDPNLRLLATSERP